MKEIICNSVIVLFLIIPGIAFSLDCKPTAPDELGPFYKPDAPVRSGVGKGYVLAATVRSSADCRPVSNSKVEFWMAGPDGVYSDSFRATTYSDATGKVLFESHLPPAYYGRPPHIHVRVSAPGFITLITQHYLKQDQKTAAFDLVLRPAPAKTGKGVAP